MTFQVLTVLSVKVTVLSHMIMYSLVRYCHLLSYTEPGNNMFLLNTGAHLQNMWCHTPEHCNCDCCHSSTNGHHQSFACTQIYTANRTLRSRSARGSHSSETTIFTPLFSYGETLLKTRWYLGIHTYSDTMKFYIKFCHMLTFKCTQY
jgi:hypothetical protein